MGGFAPSASLVVTASNEGEEGGVVVVEVLLEPFVLNLRSAFGTSHSTTSQRTNALVTVRRGGAGVLEGLQGFGEAGLPPKKAEVYEADYADCVEYTAQYFVHAARELPGTLGRGWYCHVDAYVQGSALPAALPPSARAPGGGGGTGGGRGLAALMEAPGELLVEERVARALLGALDTHPLAARPFSRAAGSALEVALVSFWAAARGQPVYEFLGLGPALEPPRFTYYTAALDEIGEMEASARMGRQHTSYIKVKLDGDIGKGLSILSRLAAACPPPPGAAPGARLWSVDANSAWDPPRALDFLTRAAPIFMVEQPFPADLARAPPGPPGSAYDRAGWVEFKAACEARGVLVFADESVRTKEDMLPLAPYVHGVNLKMEKAGGFRAAMAAAEGARRAGLRVWLGCMVGSAINSTATAHLAGECDSAVDLDGALLVTEECGVTGGFVWGQLGGLRGQVILPDAPGLGAARGVA